MTKGYINEHLVAANTIWQMLGSQHFSLVTGCKPLYFGERDGKTFLLMSMGQNKNDISLFEVLSEGETYEMRFIRNAHAIAVYKEVTPEMLYVIFEQYTGISIKRKLCA